MSTETDEESDLNPRRHRPASLDDGGLKLHPTVSPDEARAVARKLPGPDNDDVGADGVSPDHEFDLDYTDSRGHLWTGKFACRVLSIQERVQYGLTRASMLNGMPLQSIDPGTINLIDMQAYLLVGIRKAPKWALSKAGNFDVSKLRETGMLQAIYEEVAAHASRFYGAGSG